MSQEADSAIFFGRLPGGRVWESKGFYVWDCCTVRVGQVRDRGRWYVERLDHPTIGPYRAELYRTEDEALAVAHRVMAQAKKILGGREFVEVGDDAPD
ncbi:hypothetical protein [Glycomyces sp. MUSA5-2]|uniref:hypothetical protein n=1 Tax=Glycomyces sp. MUSA5-2 TaxID=2053002 RepID=UPI00300AD31E